MPSKSRAGRVRSLNVIPSATLYVPEAEYDDYARLYRARIVPVPMAIAGITATRNYILNHTDEKWVVFIDDDVESQGYRLLDANSSLSIGLDEATWLSVFERLFCVCEDTGYPIFGVATQSSLRSVYPYQPFLWRSYVTGSCMGIINSSELRFDERYIVKEDYELCLRCIRDYGGVVAARFVFWENSHWHDEGGCKDYRTQEIEQRAIDMLIETYPRLIRRVTRGGSEYSIDLEF